jgi:hypothetical protein
MEACRSTVHRVASAGCRYNGICFDGESFWLSPRHNAPLVKWNPQTGETRDFSDLVAGGKDERYRFLPAVYAKGCVWLLPKTARHAVKINARSGETSVAREFEIDLREEEAAERKYAFALAFGDSIYAFNELRGTLIEYDCAANTRKEARIAYAAEAFAKLRSLAARAFAPGGGPVVEESEAAALDDFLNHIASQPDEEAEAEAARRKADCARSLGLDADGMMGRAGLAIYDYMKKLARAREKRA